MASPVGRRGRNLFKQKDVVRAMRSAKAGGLATIGHVEIVTKDGTTIRVFGEGSAAAQQTNPCDEVLTDAADTKRPS